MECVSCKRNEGTFKFKSLEVRSIMTPGKSGFLRKDRKPATRTQSLGNYREFGVCDSCIDKRYHEIMFPWKDFFNTCKVAIILLVFGVVILALYGGKDTVYTIGGTILTILALYRFFKYYRYARKRKEEYRKFSENNRRFVIAWDLVSRSAPKWEGFESLYFIPITSATETMKREDFIKYYGLTHDNADEFYRMIHGKGKHSKNTQTEDETDERIPNTDLTEEEMRD